MSAPFLKPKYIADASLTLSKMASDVTVSLSAADNALPAASFTSAAVTGKLITGYSSGAGAVSATDTILQSINKINGNVVVAKASADSAFPVVTSDPVAPTLYQRWALKSGSPATYTPLTIGTTSFDFISSSGNLGGVNPDPVRTAYTSIAQLCNTATYANGTLGVGATQTEDNTRTIASAGTDTLVITQSTSALTATPGAGFFYHNDIRYDYTSYTGGTKTFAGVSPTPLGLTGTIHWSGILPTINGVTLVSGDRLLNMSLNNFRNGVYSVTQVGNGNDIPWIFTRATDYDEAAEISHNSEVLVSEGTFASTYWTPSLAVATPSTEAITLKVKATDDKLLVGDPSKTIITGYVSGAGTVASTDSVLAAIQKLNGNAVAIKSTADAALPAASFTDEAVQNKLFSEFNPASSGAVSSSDMLWQAISKINGNANNAASVAGSALPTASFTDAAVTGKLITGYASGSGTVADTDTILQAIQKLNGNDALKLPLAGGTMSGSIALGGSNKVTGAAAGSDPTDYVTKAQLDSLSGGLSWHSPIVDPIVQDDSLSSPPSTTGMTHGEENPVFLVSSSATGDWTGLEGRLLRWSNGTSTWLDILGRVVATGDNLGILLENLFSYTADGGFVGKENYTAIVVVATPGSYTYTFHAPTDKDALSDLNPYVNSAHFGHSYTYNSALSSWIEFQGPGALGAGVGLSYDGNVLNVNLGAGIMELPSDEIGIDLYTGGGLELYPSGAGGQLRVASGGISDAMIASTFLKTSDFTDASVTGKVITGYSSGSGTVAATDTILQAINKLNGNDALKLPTASFTDAAVTGKLITGFTSGYGVVAATDTILQAINKLDGNNSDAQITGKLITGYISGAGTVASTDTILQAIQKLNGNIVALPAIKASYKQKIVLSGDDITAQYVDLAFVAEANSLSVISGRVPLNEGAESAADEDYSVNLTGGASGVTRVSFEGPSKTAGASALIAGDVLYIQYRK